MHFDDNGFFVVPGFGNTTHSFHPKHSSLKCYLPPRLLDEVNKTFLTDMSTGSASDSIIRNVLYIKTGSLMTEQNVNWMKQNTKEILENDIQIKEKDISPSDSMIINCERKGYDYMVLCQDPLNGSMPVSQTFSGITGQTSEDNITDLTEQEEKSMHQFIMEGRASLGLLDCHKYMIYFAWVSQSDKENFNLFPEVITVDTVAGTNNEGRPLLIMGGKYSNGKMFIFLRAYLPYEKVWICR